MAIMIPEKPHNFEPASQEGLMFHALELMPDEYYIFHSFKISSVTNNVFYESETDFVIFHKNFGVICIESKAGHVRYETGNWLYGSGMPMHNGGPFNQASSNKWKLIKYIENSSVPSVLNCCKFLHAVWFPSISDLELRKMTLPSEADKNIVLTKDALKNPEPYIERIFRIDLPNRIKTKLSDNDFKRMVREVLCPQFNVFPSASFDADLKRLAFHRLLNEQVGILNFLGEQKSAVINGAAGTGKTMIAVEKAQRHAADGEKVLFLCYNAQLRNYLVENYGHTNISYYTISGLACRLCNSNAPDYTRCRIVLEDMYLSESYLYQHIIIDEGQDFGMEDIEEAEILQIIHDIILDNEQLNGSFYVFYDKLQLVQSKNMPRYIEEADCRLTLYRNCRNTENIATTSLRPISERTPKLVEGAVKGSPAKIHFCESRESAISQIGFVVESLENEGFKDVVLLSCKTEESSLLSEEIKGEKYRNKYRFSTCRKFKGLEADAVILVDVDSETFNSNNVLLYYVGTSRARLKLEIITTLSDDDCRKILEKKLNHQGKKSKRPKKDLASALNAVGSIAEY